MSAALALTEAGLRVQLLEARGFAGGRACSYQHPGTAETVDNCQHALFGCCTNLINFYERLGVSDKIRWSRQMTMLAPDGGESLLGSVALPAPLHGLPRLLAAEAFSLKDKLALAWALSALLWSKIPLNTEESLAEWLERHHQSKGAMRRFWHLVIASALNADLDQISMGYAAKVIRELFLSSAEAGAMGVSQVPLSELYANLEVKLAESRGSIHYNAAMEAAEWNHHNMQWTVETRKGIFESDDLILALPFDVLKRLMPRLPQAGEAMSEIRESSFRAESPIHLRNQLEGLRHWPIVSMHLWFDRDVTELEHAILLDREWHWMYNQSKIQSGKGGSYIELLSSASKRLTALKRPEALEIALRELGEFLPAVKSARLVKFAFIKEVRATFGVPPGVDANRPTYRSPWRNCYLAGDWTATGWPSTMESAARSGYIAAEKLCASIGKECRFLVPDLKPKGLMRLLP